MQPLQMSSSLPAPAIIESYKIKKQHSLPQAQPPTFYSNPNSFILVTSQQPPKPTIQPTSLTTHQQSDPTLSLLPISSSKNCI
jgi:hypothetical protein